MKQKIILVLSLCFVLNVGYAKTVHPQRGVIQNSFSEPAKTRLENVYSINMPLASRLERITVKEGTPVVKNQVVARLVQEPLLQAVNKAKSYLKTVKLEYALQKKTLQRYEKLGKKGFLEASALDEALAKEKVLLAKISESSAELAIMQYNLQISVLRSPVVGIILNRYTQGGKWLQTGTQLLNIGNLQELEVICEVLTQEAQQLKIGDPVLLSSIGSSVVLTGQVKQIYPAGFTKKSSLGVDEQRVNVIVAIKDSEKAHLGVGYRVQAKFLVGTREKNALVIPRFSVLQDPKGNYYVFVVKNNKLYKQIVQLGIMTDEQVEVIKGLTTKDSIVEQPTADMQEGMKV